MLCNDGCTKVEARVTIYFYYRCVKFVQIINHGVTMSAPTNSIAGVVLNPESVYINQQEYRVQKYFPISGYEMDMSLIDILTVRMGKRRSVRNLLSGFGVRQWCTFSALLSKLHVTEAIALLHNWVLREIRHEEMVTYRILEDYTDDVYQLSLASRKGGLYVERIQKRQDLKNKLLYYWPGDATFATMTREIIAKSMQDADYYNVMPERYQTTEAGENQWNMMDDNDKQDVLQVIEKKLNNEKLTNTE